MDSFVWFAKGYSESFPTEIQKKIEDFLMDTFQDIDSVIQNHFKDYLQADRLTLPPVIDRNDKYWPILRLTQQSIDYYLSQPGNTKEDLNCKLFPKFYSKISPAEINKPFSFTKPAIDTDVY